ncbi:MAG: zinc-dependent alcohol dehydrogenase family protein [SAR324 cluster bacterium]|nr:zinc-dependent alcohol dehydrogenase family protein [SAR324 cluster bacterium]
MKASLFLGKHNIQVEDFDLGQVEPEEVLIDIKYCGVCGTDVHIFNGHEGSADVTPPIILGHECSGVVARVGRDVRNVKVGDRVTVNPNDMCGQCYFCRSGRSAFCENHLAIGTIANGGFAEQMKVRAKQVLKLNNISFESAALVEPLSCCFNVFKMINYKLGDVYMIVGAGPIGLMMIQLARIAGASKIIVVEIVAEKREQALRFGADYAFDPEKMGVQEAIRKNSIKNIDKIIECVGLKQTQQYCIDNIGKGTEVMFFGLGDPDQTIEIKPFELFRKQASLQSSFINPDTFEKTLELVESGVVDLEAIISDVVEQSELPFVLKDSKRREKGKVLVQFS